MGFYRDAVFPRVMNKLMDNETTREIRTRVCGELAGDVVEIGFGTGLNLPHLPATVTRLRAVDPSEQGAKIAAARVAASTVTVDLAGLDGQALPFLTSRRTPCSARGRSAAFRTPSRPCVRSAGYSATRRPSLRRTRQGSG